MINQLNTRTGTPAKYMVGDRVFFLLKDAPTARHLKKNFTIVEGEVAGVRLRLHTFPDIATVTYDFSGFPHVVRDEREVFFTFVDALRELQNLP